MTEKLKNKIAVYEEQIEWTKKFLKELEDKLFCTKVELVEKQEEGQIAKQRVRVYGEFSKCPSFLIIVYKYQTVIVIVIKMFKIKTGEYIKIWIKI